MNLLIDTNVLIGLEDDGEVKEQFSSLSRNCLKHGIGVFVHPTSKAEIDRNPDQERRKAMQSRIKKFQTLDIKQIPGKEALAKAYGPCATLKDIGEAILLHAIEVKAVDYLVSDDNNLHKRAKKVGLDNRVFTVEDALAWIQTTYEPKEVALPTVEEVLAYNLDFKDPIFDELRKDYDPEFDKWSDKIRQQHRKCWVVQYAGRLAALVIRKDETHAEAGTLHPGPKILKISTFKVSEDFRGHKLGEQLVKQILWYAQNNSYDLVYLTAYPKQKSLLMLLEAYGFKVTATLAKGEKRVEKVIVKGALQPEKGETRFEAVTRAYPNFVCTGAVRKFVIPIKPAYHAKLFPECVWTVPGEKVQLLGRPGNTIEKVYLCHSKTILLREGDVIFFYMSKQKGVGGSQSITTVGVIKKVRRSLDFEEVRRWTAKRSVYSDDEIKTMILGKRSPLLVIDFLLIGHLEEVIPLDVLTGERILGGWPQSIVQIEEKAFSKLKKRLKLGFSF